MSSKRPSRHDTNGFRPIQAFGQSRNVYINALQFYESDSTLEQICKRFQMVPGHSNFQKTRKCGSRWFQSELLDDSRWIQSTQNDSERFHKVRISSNRLHFPKRGYRWFQFSLDGSTCLIMSHWNYVQYLNILRCVSNSNFDFCALLREAFVLR